MTSAALPAALSAALNGRMQGVSQSGAGQRAEIISHTYRTGGGSRGITSADDALAYALVRMPATYAAVAASLNAIKDLRPDFAPRSLLDCGAGPGTATWAARAGLSSLQTFVMLDANPALRALALDLVTETGLSDVRYVLGDAIQQLDAEHPADLVIASYAINELDAEQRLELIDRLWDKTRDTLLIVEPGTPAGYQTIIRLRDRLITKGGRVIAPCPHDLACPLIAPDWCHFSQRLPRSRAHMQLKAGFVPFEDERFSYVALSRADFARPAARVLAQPIVNKVAITTKLCTPSGLKFGVAARRDKDAYRAARKRDWGDSLEHNS